MPPQNIAVQSSKSPEFIFVQSEAMIASQEFETPMSLQASLRDPAHGQSASPGVLRSPTPRANRGAASQAAQLSESGTSLPRPTHLLQRPHPEPCVHNYSQLSEASLPPPPACLSPQCSQCPHRDLAASLCLRTRAATRRGRVQAARTRRLPRPRATTAARPPRILPHIRCLLTNSPPLPNNRRPPHFLQIFSCSCYSLSPSK